MIKSVRINEKKINEVDTIKLSVQAKQAKALYPDTIDVSIGSLYDDDGNFIECKALTKAINCISPEDKYSYSSSTGGKEFQNNMESWIFGDELNIIKERKQLLTIGSLGGAGALSNLFFSYLQESESLVIADNNWNVYLKMLETMNINYEQYELFDDKYFNIKGFIDACNKVINKDHKLVAVLNTPNHNPTGYSLSNDETKVIIDYLNSLTVSVVLILDIAYIDFASYEETRKTLAMYSMVNNNILPVIVFSGSKSFSSYGIRFGSMTFMAPDTETLNNALDTQSLILRTRSSCPNKMAISAFNYIMNTKELKEEYLNDLTNAKEIVKQRADKIIALFEKHNILFYPYTGGFFILVKTDKQMDIYEKLKERNIFTLPIDKGLRIAICSLKIKDIERLVFELVTILNK